VFYLGLVTFNLFGANRYTIAIMASGLLLLPAATECYAANLALLFYIVLFNVLVYAYVNCTNKRYLINDYWHVENHRETFGKHEDFTKSLTIAANIKSANEDQLKYMGLISNVLQGPEGMTLDEQARKVWNEIDINGDGFITKEELETLLTKYGASEDQMKIEKNAFESIFGGSDKIGYVHFYRWFCGGRVAMKHLSQAKALPVDEKEQAKLVFDNLDINSSGFLELWELETLLLNWGVSINDAKRFLEKFDDGDGRVSFEEFYLHMRRIWKFAIGIMIDDGSFYVTKHSKAPMFCSCCFPDNEENYVQI